jgi:hypothetical protein
MGTWPISISGKWTSPRPHQTPATPTQSQRLHPALVPQIGPISPIRPIPKPPPSLSTLFPPVRTFFRSVRAFSHRGGAFFVPCALFPTVGALFSFGARFLPPWGRFFRSVRAFSHRGGAFSVPCALFPFRARFFRSVRAFSDPCALFPLRVRFLQSGRKSPPTSSPHHKSPIPCLPSLFIPFLHSCVPHSQSLPPLSTTIA